MSFNTSPVPPKKQRLSSDDACLPKTAMEEPEPTYEGDRNPDSDYQEMDGERHITTEESCLTPTSNMSDTIPQCITSGSQGRFAGPDVNINLSRRVESHFQIFTQDVDKVQGRLAVQIPSLSDLHESTQGSIGACNISLPFESTNPEEHLFIPSCDELKESTQGSAAALNIFSSTMNSLSQQHESLHDRIEKHRDMPSPSRDEDMFGLPESLHGRVDMHIGLMPVIDFRSIATSALSTYQIVNPAVVDESSQGISTADSKKELLDTPFRTDDGLEEQIAKHFQVLKSASKLDQSFASPEPSPSGRSVKTAVNDNLKMQVSRAITFEGLLPEVTSTESNFAEDDGTKASEVSFPHLIESPATDSSSDSDDSDDITSDDGNCNHRYSSSSDDESNVHSHAIVIPDFEELGEENRDCTTLSKMALTKAFSLNFLKLHGLTEKSVNQAILDVMKLHLDNLDSKSGLQRTLTTIRSLLPGDHQLPSSAHNILKYIKSLAPPIPASTHYYCQDCQFYHGTEVDGQCAVCAENSIENNDEDNDENVGTAFGHFFSFGIGATLKYLFECRNLASAIDLASTSRTEAPGTYSDIQDGSVYKLLNRSRNQYDVNLVMNTDGVRIRDSSAKELWLVMFSIVEVPMHLRESFIIFSAVWYDAPKPKMNTFLKPNCEELATLQDLGLQWKDPSTGNTYNCKVQVLLGVLDAPARAMAQNTLQFNGEYGCNMCEIQTVRSAPIPDRKRVRVYPYVADLVLRNKETMDTQASEALERNVTHVMGVKGPSVLSIVPSIDISSFFIPEYLHSVLLGVMKQLLTIWLSLPGPWNIKYCVSVIDKRLALVKHPDFVHRAPRVLSKMKFMKASDFYYFLMFEGLPVLHGYLPDRYLQHFILLVRGMYLLLQSNVKECDIEEADKLLLLFVQQLSDLYSDRQLTSNIHQLCHLALVVRRYGPLSCNNAFIFENMNGLIGKATHGTKHVAREIVNNISTAQGVQVLKNIVKGLLSAGSWCVRQNVSAEVLGKSKDVTVSSGEAEVFGASALIFSRAKIGSDVFTSEIHKELRTENFHVMFNSNTIPKYASIKYFAKANKKLYVCLRLYKVDHLKVFYHLETRSCVSHLIPVEITNNVIVKDVNEISLVKIGKIGCFLFTRPNLLHGDVN